MNKDKRKNKDILMKFGFILLSLILVFTFSFGSVFASDDISPKGEAETIVMDDNSAMDIPVSKDVIDDDNSQLLQGDNLSGVTSTDMTNEEVLNEYDNQDISYDEDTFIVWTKQKLEFDDYEGFIISQTKFGDEWMTVLKKEAGQELLDAMNQAQDTAVDESLPSHEDSVVVEPNQCFDAQFVPNDPQIKSKAGHYYGAQYQNVFSAWDIIPSSGNKVLVGVVDTGVNANHTDLKGIVNTSLSRTVHGGKITKGVKESDTTTYHGTAVCGVIGGKANNSVASAGVASGKNNNVVSIIVCDAYTKSGSSGSFKMSDVALSVKYLADAGCKVINLSLGDQPTSNFTTIDKTEKTALDYAYGKSISVVVAAGNENSDLPTYPSDYPTVISVISAKTMTDKSSFSSFGPNKDIASFGEKVSVPSSSTNGVQLLNGTSISAPVVTGAIALMQYGTSYNLSPRHIKNILYSSTNQGSFSNNLGFGVLNVKSAVQNAMNVGKYNSKPTGIKVNRTSISLGKGYNTTVDGAIIPVASNDVKLKYSSSNTKIFTVDANGMLKGVAAGKANLVVKSSSNESISKTIPVTVYTPKFSQTVLKTKFGSGKTEGKVTLSWTASSGATYKVFGSTDNNKYSLITTTKNTSLTTPVGYGSSYFYVQPVKDSSTGEKSNTCGLSYNGAPKIKNYVDRGNTIQGVMVSTKLAGADGYELLKYDTKTKKDVHVKYFKTDGYTTTSGSVGTSQKYRARAYKNFLGKKTYSNYSPRVSMSPTPKVPLSCGYSVSRGKITLKIKPRDNCTGIKIYRAVYSKKGSSGSFKLYKTIKTNGKTSTITVKDTPPKSKHYCSYILRGYGRANGKDYLSKNYLKAKGIKYR